MWIWLSHYIYCFQSLMLTNWSICTLPFVLFGFKFVQDIMLPLMVKNGRVSRAGNKDMLSPIDYVPAECAAWRFSMLNDSTGLSDKEIQSIRVPTLLVRNNL